MYKLFLARIFAWRWYHYNIILARDSSLRANWERIQKIESEQGNDQVKYQLYSLQPLLLGAIQPADFVLKWAELKPEEMVQLSQEATNRQTSYDNDEERKKLVKKLSYERFKVKRRLFEGLVLKEGVTLQVELNVLTDLYVLKIIIIVLFTLIAILVLSLSLIFYPQNNPLALLSDLTFASVLLVPIIIGIFAYSQLLRANHRRKRDIELNVTRLSAARHVFNTLEQVEVIQQRLDTKLQERSESQQTVERQQLAFEEARQKVLNELEYSRIKNIVNLARDERLSSLVIEQLFLILLQQRRAGLGSELPASQGEERETPE